MENTLDRDKNELLTKLSDCVVDMEDEAIIPVAETYIKNGYPAIDGIMEGLVTGMNRAGVLYDQQEYFIPELLCCSDAMYNGINIIKPHIVTDKIGDKPKVVIGVVEGDTHDIGKNLVKIMLETAGFDIIDLGRDVPLDKFVSAVIDEKADIICMSTLMSTTMEGMRQVVNKLKDAKVRDKCKVLIGGGCISQSFADEIHADGYAANATSAVRLAKSYVTI